MIRIVINQIGCGGVGSWFYPLAIKTCSLFVKEKPCLIDYHLIDFDIVEERNCNRQNFEMCNVNTYKCDALVEKHIKYINNSRIKVISTLDSVEAFQMIDKRDSCRLSSLNANSSITKTTIIFIGAVDNINAREQIMNVISNTIRPTNDIFYIDGGNEKTFGQVFSSHIKTPVDLVNIKSYFSPDNIAKSEQSCAFFGDQSIAINNLIASIMFSKFVEILTLAVDDNMDSYKNNLVNINLKGLSSLTYI